MATPTPAPLPTDGTISTATKAVFTVGAICLIAAPAALPYSPLVSGALAAIGGAALAVGAVIHAYWDHSP